MCVVLCTIAKYLRAHRIPWHVFFSFHFFWKLRLKILCTDEIIMSKTKFKLNISIFRFNQIFSLIFHVVVAAVLTCNFYVIAYNSNLNYVDNNYDILKFKCSSLIQKWKNNHISISDRCDRMYKIIHYMIAILWKFYVLIACKDILCW